MQRVAVIGAGTMGHGIAQVCAAGGYRVHLCDANPDALQRGMAQIRRNLDKGIARGKLTEQQRDLTLEHLSITSTMARAVDAADLIVEAVPESMELKQRVFDEVAAHAPSHAIFATNTSSLSIGALASHLRDPGRLIGTHFFNPVHIMALLEVVVADTTRPEIVDAIRTFGERIGKQVIEVRDVPGFATSRLGVCLGMEAIRMLEQGVASAADIDKAMVLGYRHPVGPLELTDRVGLDVRMAIGEYLSDALGNPAFDPPDLMRRMVAEGRLGAKVGHGFYRWENGRLVTD